MDPHLSVPHSHRHDPSGRIAGPSSEELTVSWCTNCGTELGDQDRFCRACGQGRSALAETPQAPTEQREIAQTRRIPPTGQAPANPRSPRTLLAHPAVLATIAVVVGAVGVGAGLYLTHHRTHGSALPIAHRGTTTTTGARASDRGFHWVRLSYGDGLSGGVQAISCASASLCALVDSAGGIWQYQGNKWQVGLSDPPPDSSPGYVTISCGSAASCLALEPDGSDGGWDGKGWGSGILNVNPDGQWSVNTVACASASLCVATVNTDGPDLTNSNAYVVTTDGGGTWGNPVQAGSSTVTALACAPGGDCFVATSDSGVTSVSDASSVPLSSPPSPVESLSCWSASGCIAFDRAAQTLEWEGSSWKVEGSLPHLRTGAPLSCTSAFFCMASNSEGKVLRWNGSTWATENIPLADEDALGPLSCTSGGFCVVGSQGNNETYVRERLGSTATSPPTGSPGTTTPSGGGQPSTGSGTTQPPPTTQPTVPPT
jgi:hypothetical protein